MNKDILFYSNFCFHCKNILNLINKNSNIKENLFLFCIDNNKNKVPSFIKSVPTILTTNKDILIGKDVFNLITQSTTKPLQGNNYPNHEQYQSQNQQQQHQLQQQQQYQPQHQQQQPQQQQQQQYQPQQQQQKQQYQQQPQEKENNSSDPMAWHIKEMGSGFSDNYSFLEADTSAEGMGGSSISHNFAFLNNLETSQTSLNLPTETKKNEKKDYLSERMEALVNAREGDLPKEIKRI